VKQGFVDEARIGMWGWSYGGYMTAFALTHSKRFKMGIAGAPVTDWRLYDSIYTERYMGLPAENEAGYAAGSVLSAAKDLHGRLLVICGEIDENVHAQNSLQLAAALQKASKQFDFMMYPGNRHGITQQDQRKHLYAMMAEYVKTHL
jgi:dipeptidyl-peptidase-4